MEEFYGFIKLRHNVHVNCLFTFFSVQPGVGTGDPGGQLGRSFHNGFAAVRGNVGINLGKVRFAGHQQHSQLLDTVGR